MTQILIVLLLITKKGTILSYKSHFTFIENTVKKIFLQNSVTFQTKEKHILPLLSTKQNKTIGLAKAADIFFFFSFFGNTTKYPQQRTL